MSIEYDNDFMARFLLQKYFEFDDLQTFVNYTPYLAAWTKLVSTKKHLINIADIPTTGITRKTLNRQADYEFQSNFSRTWSSLSSKACSKTYITSCSTSIVGKKSQVLSKSCYFFAYSATNWSASRLWQRWVSWAWNLKFIFSATSSVAQQGTYQFVQPY